MAKNNSSTNYYYNRSRRVGRFMPSKDFGGVGDWIKREVRRDLFTPPPKPRKDFGRKLPKVKPGFGRGLGAAGRFALGQRLGYYGNLATIFTITLRHQIRSPTPATGGMKTCVVSL